MQHHVAHVIGMAQTIRYVAVLLVVGDGKTTQVVFLKLLVQDQAKPVQVAVAQVQVQVQAQAQAQVQAQVVAQVQ
jgi:hypothetical protein